MNPSLWVFYFFLVFSSLYGVENKKNDDPSQKNNTTSQTLTLNDRTFNKDFTYEGKHYELFSLCVRKATWFQVAVYVLGMYIEKPEPSSLQPTEFFTTKSSKLFLLQFVRDVGEKDVKDTWVEAFNKNCLGKCKKESERFDELLNLMKEAHNKDEMKYVFVDNGVLVDLPSGRKFFESTDFRDILFSSWLGEHAISNSLKECLINHTLPK